MGIQKEKIIYIIQLISIVFITIFFLLIQLTQNKINNYDSYNSNLLNKISLLQSRLNSYSSEITSIKSSNYDSLKGDEVDSDPNIQQLNEKYKNKQINANEFKTQLLSLYNTYYSKTVNEMNTFQTEFNDNIKKDVTCWFAGCHYLLNQLYIAQVISIMVVLSLFIFIFNRHGKPYLTGIEKKNKLLEEELRLLKEKLEHENKD